MTVANRSSFVSSYVSFLLDSRHRRQFSAFLSGFRLVAADVALDLFRPEELQLLVAGTNLLDFKVGNMRKYGSPKLKYNIGSPQLGVRGKHPRLVSGSR